MTSIRPEWQAREATRAKLKLVALLAGVAIVMFAAGYYIRGYRDAKKVTTATTSPSTATPSPAVPSEPEASKPSTPEISFTDRVTNEGETLSGIALAVHGTAATWHMIATDNNIAGPCFVIPAGGHLNIRNISDEEKQKAEADADEKGLWYGTEDCARTSTEPNAQPDEQPVEKATALPDIPSLPELGSEVSAEKMPAVVAPAPMVKKESLVELPLYPSRKVMVSAPAPTEVLAQKVPAMTSKEQAYEISLNGDALNESIQKVLESGGQFPARFVDRQNNNGKWKREVDTVAYVHQLGGVFFVDFPATQRIVPTEHSLLVLSLKNKGSKPTLLPVGGINFNTPTTLPVDHWETFQKKDYRALRTSFPKQTSPLFAMTRFALPVTMRSGMGFLTMGPFGAAMGPTSMVSDFVAGKIRGNQQRIQIEMAEPPVAVQFTIASQATQIANLGKRVSTQEHQIKALQTALAKLQAQQGGKQ